MPNNTIEGLARTESSLEESHARELPFVGRVGIDVSAFCHCGYFAARRAIVFMPRNVARTFSVFSRTA